MCRPKSKGEGRMFREWFYRNKETGVRRHKTSEDNSEEIWMYQSSNEWEEISKEEYNRVSRTTKPDFLETHIIGPLLGKDNNHGKIN